MSKTIPTTKTDIILIGAGVMSATLGTMLKELQPDVSIEIFERLDKVAAESSDAWNNAGTGHSALCELNYTPELEDGSIDISKAIKIIESFEESRQFWSYLVEQGVIENPQEFIHSIPHMSFVWGEENINYLHKRQQALTKSHLFSGMEFSDDAKKISSWIPIMMEGRDATQKVAATRIGIGTDVNFGVLTRSLIKHLVKKEGANLHLQNEVLDIKKTEEGWEVKVEDLATGEKRKVMAKFVFIGAGGGALELLEKSDIPEGKGFGGFPVGGQWLRCTNQKLIKRHAAKVYGKPSLGAPPMSVPHLDTRVIDGKKALLFGPYAGFSTKFLKQGSFWDLPDSIHLDNILPMIRAGIDNIPLTEYLITQVMQSPEEKLNALQEYLPTAKQEDWELAIAGQRVQVIKKDEEHGGILEFGTEVVAAADGSIAALLGASPGASTSVSIMLSLIQKCFKNEVKTDAWQAKLKQMIPSYGQSLSKNEALTMQVRAWTNKALQLKTV